MSAHHLTLQIKGSNACGEETGHLLSALWGGAEWKPGNTLLGDPCPASAAATPSSPSDHVAGKAEGDYRFVPRMEPPCPVQPPTSDQPISFIYQADGGDSGVRKQGAQGLHK